VNKSTVFCSARNENFGIHQQSQFKLTHFVLPRSQKFRNLPTEATQIHCILFCCAAKIWEFPNQNNSAAQREMFPKPTQARSAAKFLNLQQQKNSKLTAFCSFTNIMGIANKHCI
jgi:hypothetical protein